ncbi:unnamed protein product [Euphydryas editha]|uniref:Uncharacterized protein n=1 Tax=Euphydryas editha TaxID=104508 RepID=A0AAU9VCE8_EUPED|nr:unnamed protein product [Euphydryas editha]
MKNELTRTEKWQKIFITKCFLNLRILAKMLARYSIAQMLLRSDAEAGSATSAVSVPMSFQTPPISRNILSRNMIVKPKEV